MSTAMHIEFRGTRFKVASDFAELSEIVRTARANPAWLLLQGCERCGTVCTRVASCACCERYSRTTGYPDDGHTHRSIMEMHEFLRRAEARIRRDAA